MLDHRSKTTTTTTTLQKHKNIKNQCPKSYIGVKSENMQGKSSKPQKHEVRSSQPQRKTSITQVTQKRRNHENTTKLITRIQPAWIETTPYQNSIKNQRKVIKNINFNAINNQTPKVQ
jgi:hypothetical protein